METDPTGMCALLIGVPDVSVIGVGELPHWLRVDFVSADIRLVCEHCEISAHAHGHREVVLEDLPVFGRPTRLVWHKR